MEKLHEQIIDILIEKIDKCMWKKGKTCEYILEINNGTISIELLHANDENDKFKVTIFQLGTDEVIIFNGTENLSTKKTTLWNRIHDQVHSATNKVLNETLEHLNKL